MDRKTAVLILVAFGPAFGQSTLPTISNVITAGNFGAKPAVAPGVWLEVYGTNFTSAPVQWTSADFNGDLAPTMLAGIRVLINGQPGFLSFASPGQINVQAPAGVPNGGTWVQVVNSAGASALFPIGSVARLPLLLAPANFSSAGKQYAAGLFADGTFVGLPGLVPGASFRVLRPNEPFTLYGIGFGDVTPAIPPGQIARVPNSLANISVSIGGRPAIVQYAGLALNYVGLYQINVIAPVGLAGDQPLTVSVSGTPVAQTLSLTFQSLQATPPD